MSGSESMFGREERELLDESIQRYFADNYPHETFRAYRRAVDGIGYGAKHWRQYAELGWLGVGIPEEYGGAGGGLIELGILFAAAGRHLAMEPLLQTLAQGAPAIVLVGSAAQRSLLEAVVAGKHQIALCHYEPKAGYGRRWVETSASEFDGGFRLNGTKTFSVGAHTADTLLVSARIGAAGGPVGFFLVPRTTDGVDQTTAVALDGRLGAKFDFDNVEVESASLLGESTTDRLGLVDHLLDRGALLSCAEAAGAMAAVTEQTIEYLKSRKQFGQPLSAFQVIQHRLVDMRMACEESRAAVHSALAAMDRSARDAQVIVWSAKVAVAQAAHHVGGDAIQLHGGMGMTDELAIGHYYKRLSQCENQFGDANWYLSQLA